ncbi:MAG: TrkH family potassium uptake protein [Proteobacteria bacterium]|nr:TrkH family potassium uptake protein [Pseudomonadota bacterium]MCP4920477.1 TrkH family potassium uptake protein [Pseudomonadota bacterium]
MSRRARWRFGELRSRVPQVARPVGLLMVGVALAMAVSGLVGVAMGSTEGALQMAGSAALVGAFAGMSLWVGREASLEDLDRREALLVVTISWVALCVAGGVPFVIGADFTLADAIFESTSGFTTTGATILPEIEERLNPALHFWRMLSHWLGGMGIVVLFVAVFPALGVGGKHLFRGEAPGPKTKGLSPRIRESASVLWKVYLGFTLFEAGALWLAGLSPFDAITHAFSTLGTGGFSTMNGSVADFDNVVVEMIILVFMVIAGLNFGLIPEAIKRGPTVMLKDTQTRVYVAILAAVTGVCALALASQYGIGNALRYASFQTASVMSTTGFGTHDFETWPSVTRMLLLGLYFTGGCSGSTAGGMKLIRVIILVKAAVAELKRSFRPHLVEPVRVGRSSVSSQQLTGILAFMGLYVLTVAIGAVWVALVEQTDGTTSIMASLACVSNVGPGFGLVGPTDHFGFFTGPTKVVLSGLMLLGRLEFFTILALLTPGFWRR